MKLSNNTSLIEFIFKSNCPNFKRQIIIADNGTQVNEMSKDSKYIVYLPSVVLPRIHRIVNRYNNYTLTSETDTFYISAAKDLPQPHVCVALGFLNEKPPPMSASLKSSCIPYTKRRLLGSHTAETRIARNKC